jgi:hypothetical protein
MKAIKGLPKLDETWEVGVYQLLPKEQGPAWIVVVDDQVRPRAVVSMSSNDALDGALIDAARAPLGGCVPGRPRRVLVNATELEGRVARIFGKKTAVDTEPELECADAAALVVRAAIGGMPPAPGISQNIGAWRIAFRTLYSLNPWPRMRRRLRFRFGDELPALQGASIVLSGNREDPSISLFHSDADWDAFAAALAADDVGVMDTATVWRVGLEPPSLLQQVEIATCQVNGLVIDETLYVHIVAIDQGAMRGLIPDEQDTLLAAFEGMVQTLARAPNALREDCTQTIKLSQGGTLTVSVETAPDVVLPDSARA